MYNAGQPRLASRLISVVLVAIAAVVPAIIAIGLVSRAAAVVNAAAHRLSPFWSAVPVSLAFALGIGVVVALLTLMLTPGTDGTDGTRSVRVAALVVAASVPPIVLVLGATALATVLSQSLSILVSHIIAIYPVVALLAVLAVERDLRRVAKLSFEQDLRPSQAATVFVNVTAARLAAIVLAGATLVFQNYLINLCLSDDPSRDALVALGALSPHTGLDWTAVMSAGGILWLCSAAVGAMLLSAISPTLNRGVP